MPLIFERATCFPLSSFIVSPLSFSRRWQFLRRGDHGSRSRWFAESETRARLFAFFPFSALTIHPCLNAPSSPQILVITIQLCDLAKLLVRQQEENNSGKSHFDATRRLPSATRLKLTSEGTNS
jgi:hypothetical protein